MYAMIRTRCNFMRCDLFGATYVVHSMCCTMWRKLSCEIYAVRYMQWKFIHVVSIDDVQSTWCKLTCATDNVQLTRAIYAVQPTWYKMYCATSVEQSTR
eukprot:5655574-Pyramimonas_sp.AAC.1